MVTFGTATRHARLKIALVVTTVFVAGTTAIVSAAPADAATLTITTPATLPGAIVGVPYSTQLSASGAEESVLWHVTKGAIPPGLTLSETSGEIAGTPTAPGANSFTLQATDPDTNKSATKAMTLKVSAPVIQTKALPPGRTAVPYDAPIGVSGGKAPLTWSITAGALPPGLTFNPASGDITGAPTTAGTASISIRVTDSSSPLLAATAKLTMTIAGPLISQDRTDPPVLGVSYHGRLSTLGMFGPATWTLAKGPIPTGLSLGADGTITGTPTAAGSKSFSVRAVDSANPSTIVTATIKLAPVAIAATTTAIPRGETGIAYDYDLHAIGGIPPYTWSGKMPAGLTLQPDGHIAGTPTGPVTQNITVQIHDSANSHGTQTLPIQIFTPTPAPQTLAVADGSACALDGGIVQCWGNGSAGQLGYGGTLSFNTPVQVAGITGVTAIDGGKAHYCALLSDKTVWCWGDNSNGAVGAPGFDNQFRPVKVANLSGVIAISTGDDFSCAVLTNATVKCWGTNIDHELGTASTLLRSAAPVLIGSVSGAVGIAAGARHVCVLLRNGFVECWGSNQNGALGIAGGNSAAPHVVPGTFSITVQNIIAVSAGDSFTCVLNFSNVVACWGANGLGQLGFGTTSPSELPIPNLDLLGLNPGGLSAGGDHACVVLADQTARCWGYNGDGELGDGMVELLSASPVEVVGLTGVTEIAAGAVSTCARASGGIWCSGDNSTGELGNGSHDASTTPVRALVNSVTAIAAGYAHTCAIKAGLIKCWGANDFGQLGNGTTTPSSVPVTQAGLTNVVALALGSSHTCAAIATGVVFCWGRNDRGQLGDGTTANRAAPVMVTGLTNVVALTAGDGHTCALQTTHTVRCWGDDSFGQLGDGGSGIHPTPVAVAGITSANAVAAGGSYTCVLDGVDGQGLDLGRVRCWGANESGQVGDGTNHNRLVPTEVAGGIYRGQLLAAGSSHTCVIGAAIHPSCWGADNVGQLGDNAVAAAKYSPSAMNTTAHLIGISAGGQNTCVLLAGGGVQCTGTNTIGQLGNNTTTAARNLTAVSGVTTARLIATGGNHSCAVLADNTVKCWGYNWRGQLGDGTTQSRLTPVQVIGL